MAGNRKGKGQQQHQNQTNHGQGRGSSNYNKMSSSSDLKNTDDFHDDLSDILGGSATKSTLALPIWKDVAVVGLVLIVLGLCSVVIGIAAGMTISIHYIQEPVHHVDRNGMVISSQHKVTTYDDEMVARNIMSAPSNLDFGRILTRTFRGERTVVSVVQETDSLLGDDTGYSDETSRPKETAHYRDIFFAKPSVQPTKCRTSGKYPVMGFSDWTTLKAAVREANALSAEKFLRWNEYFSSIEPHEFGAFADDALYYEDESVFVICPGVTLKARKGPIFFNAENIRVECDGCSIDVGGTHFAFGPHARNALIRGITFKGAQYSSLNFYYDGADATFEDCLWINGGGSPYYGPVADVNSSSVINFNRCKIADKRGASPGRHNIFGLQNAFSYAFSIEG